MYILKTNFTHTQNGIGFFHLKRPSRFKYFYQITYAVTKTDQQSKNVYISLVRVSTLLFSENNSIVAYRWGNINAYTV